MFGRRSSLTQVVTYGPEGQYLCRMMCHRIVPAQRAGILSEKKLDSDPLGRFPSAYSIFYKDIGPPGHRSQLGLIKDILLQNPNYIQRKVVLNEQ
jgi:hypothetical protein